MAGNDYINQPSTDDMERQLDELRQVIAERDITIAEQSQELQAARNYLETLKRMLFGPKSERVAEPSAGQGHLFHEAEADSDQYAKDTAAAEATPEKF